MVEQRRSGLSVWWSTADQVSAPPRRSRDDRTRPGQAPVAHAAGAGRCGAGAHDLVESARPYLPSDGVVVVHDLGCGTGSMARWLALRLNGPQHWVMLDRDAELLALVAAHPPVEASDGAPVTIETRRRDITRLDPGELAGTALITASALLDMLTADEVEPLVATCVGVGCPVLIALSVTGRVDLTPADPFDYYVTDAFNAHQRRNIGARVCSAPTRSARWWTVSPAWASMSWSDPAPGGSAPDRLLSRPGGSPAGWLRPASSVRNWALSPSRMHGAACEAAAGQLSVTVHHQGPVGSASMTSCDVRAHRGRIRLRPVSGPNRGAGTRAAVPPP